MGGAGLTLPPAARCARAECSLPERLRPAHILGYPEISWDYLRISQDVRLLTGNRGFVPVGGETIRKSQLLARLRPHSQLSLRRRLASASAL